MISGTSESEYYSANKHGNDILYLKDRTVHRSTWIGAGTLQKPDEVSMYVPENVDDLLDVVIVGRTILTC